MVDKSTSAILFSPMRQKKQVSIATAGENEDEQPEEKENDIQEVLNEIGLTHPITYDGYDICELTKARALSRFTKTMCDYFELPRKSTDRKPIYTFKIYKFCRRTVTVRRYAVLLGTPRLGRTPFEKPREGCTLLICHA